jgi:predicted N-formylglutamate amidohydrolase
VFTPAHTAAAGDAAAGVVEIVNPQGAGGVVVVCEHASNFIPPEYHDLGLGKAERISHIAWDPGAMAVARELSARLNAVLIAQRISRLVYDCNRPPEAPSAVPEKSEIHRIPGNAGLDPAERRARAEAVYFPFRAVLSATIDQHVATGRSPAIVTIHSFTPVFRGVRREVEIGLLHDVDSRLVDAMLARDGAPGFEVRRNEPYGPADGVTHTLIDQALPRGLANVMIEIRNDLIADGGDQQRFGALLADWIAGALNDLNSPRQAEKVRHA